MRVALEGGLAGIGLEFFPECGRFRLHPDIAREGRLGHEIRL